ncbi:MAG: RNA polymerase sigma factor [Acidimicrobiales bacterium]
MTDEAGSDDEFDQFVGSVEPRLRSALVAAYGSDLGRTATLDALTWAWRNWDRARSLESPVGYLFRVGQSAARRSMSRARWTAPVVEEGSSSEPWFEPRLLPALRRLPRQQRVAVVLCHAMQWTHAEVAELLGVSTSTVQTHVERGVAALRRTMEVDDARTR